MMSEWEVFGAFAVEWLVMPVFIFIGLYPMEGAADSFFCVGDGIFGYNRDMNYQKSFPYLIREVISL